MIYAVNDAGVTALKTMSAAIFSSKETLNTLSMAVAAQASDHADALGPHKSSLDDALDDMASILKEASSPIDEISGLLNDIADEYQDIISNDRFSGIT